MVNIFFLITACRIYFVNVRIKTELPIIYTKTAEIPEVNEKVMCFISSYHYIIYTKT